MRNEQSPGCLGYIGDYTAQSYGETIINHYKDPGSLLNNQYFMESKALFFGPWLTCWNIADCLPILKVDDQRWMTNLFFTVFSRDVDVMAGQPNPPPQRNPPRNQGLIRPY